MAEILIVAHDPERSIRFLDYQREDEYLGAFGVVITAPGMTAEFGVTTGQGDGLDTFLEALAQDFRGWEGERSWHSIEGDLNLTATHHSGGHVALRWTARRQSWDWPEDTLWSTTISFLLDAGESMTTLAQTTKAFFTDP